MNIQQRYNKKVLIVEDEVDHATLLGHIASNQGYNVSFAYDGKQAMNNVEVSRPDLITLDLSMPRESGLLFYRKLRRNEKYSQIPVIIISGIPQQKPEARTAVKSLLEPEAVRPPDAYLDKPINKNKLVGLLGKYLT